MADYSENSKEKKLQEQKKILEKGEQKTDTVLRTLKKKINDKKE